ncbi:MAG: TonB family protein [Vicinamibacteria bacterium]
MSLSPNHPFTRRSNKLVMAKKKKFGRYEVEAELGQGAMGKVYKARDPLVDRVVAVKAIKADVLAQDETGEYRKRFQRESRAVGQLSHPNVVTIFDVGENFFVMEYLEGKSLLALIAERGSLSLDETLELVSPVADALQYAHARGIFHRDVKPANIMILEDGRPKIMDFGLAHLESTVMTSVGQFLGSPSYMAPEQIEHGEANAQADLYSLSVVTYEMLTGKKPFPGDSITTVLYKVVHAPPIPPHELKAELPREYEDIFRCALAKKPSERFTSFSEFVSALNLKQFDQLEIPVVSTPAEAAETPAAPDVSQQEETLALDNVALARGAKSRSSITDRRWGPRDRRTASLGAAAFVGTIAIVWAALSLFSSGSYAPRVETYPSGAEVWIDGTLVGTAPLELPKLEGGEHDVRVAMAGFLDYESVLNIPGEDTLVFALAPADVTLFLESQPEGAQVTIDSEVIGNAPIHDLTLEPGQHEILVERRGYDPWRSIVSAGAGESLNVEARLRRRKTAPAPTRAEPPPPAAETPPTEGRLVTLGPDDKAPKRISGSPLSYPALARKMRQQGQVVAEFIVTEEGIPIDIRIVESASPVLGKAVLDAITEWRYEPAEKDGVKVRVQMRFRQKFSLGS